MITQQIIMDGFRDLGGGGRWCHYQPSTVGWKIMLALLSGKRGK